MPRQKLPADNIKHIITETNENVANVTSANSSWQSADDEALSSSDDSTSETDNLTAEALVTRALEETNLEEIARLYSKAVERKWSELQEGGASEPRIPEMGTFWMNYGNACLTVVENSDPLLSTAHDEDEDFGKLAWEALESARLCFESGLPPCQEDSIDSLQEHVLACVNSQSDPRLSNATMGNDSECIKKLCFVRMRLGDIHQASQAHLQAQEEFAEALKLALMYRLELCDALSAAIPLAQCYMALDDQETEGIFQFCELLMQLELKENITPNRAKLLRETSEDFKLQLQEFLENRRKLKEELWLILNGAETRNPSSTTEERKRAEPEGDEITDLGSMGKRKRHNS